MTAYMFPGHGAQEVGMGRDLAAHDDYFRRLLTVGSNHTHTDLAQICAKGPDRELMKAANLQPALGAVCLSYYRKLLQKTNPPSYVLGHSLGEIIALGATGVVSDEKAIIIAAQRGMFMDEAAAACLGGMAAIMFMSIDDVQKLLAAMNRPDRIVVANDNAPNQTVVSGDNASLEEFCRCVTGLRAGKCQRLAVSGPWHSPYMVSARTKFEQWIGNVPFKKPDIPLIMNATGKEESDPERIRALITGQLAKPVYWRSCMERCRELGINSLVEIGPGRILTGLARVNGFKRGSNVVSIGSLEAIEKYEEKKWGVES